MPRLRVEVPQVCGASGTRKQGTTLEGSVAPPQPPERDDSEQPERGREHCPGPKEEAPNQSSPLL